MKALRWIVIAACSAALACSGQEISSAGDASAAGDTGGSGDSQGASDASDSGTSRSCPKRSEIAIGAACTVDPSVMCDGPNGGPKCPLCEFIPLTCKCSSGAWACQDDNTQACNRACPVDAGVDTGGSRDAATDG